MKDNDYQYSKETEKGKNTFLKTVGIFGIALFLALITVIIINI